MMHWLSALGMMLAAAPLAAQETWVYFGTGKGIYRASLDLKTGKLTEPVEVASVRAGFLAFNASQTRLFCVGSFDDGQGKPTACVESFDVDPETGELRNISRRATPSSACHLSLDATGRCLLAANYGDGSVVSFPISPTGEIGPLASTIEHEGKGVRPEQERSHAHSILADKNNHFAIAADLGIDKLVIYKLDAEAARLTPHGDVAIAAGSGPRHFVFDQAGKHAYVVNELGGTVTVLAYDADRGAFEHLQTVSTLPEDFKGINYCAEICLHPSGEFVYASNRGPDTITAFRVDPDSGKLAWIESVSAHGHWPRNFAIDPSGQYLIAAGERGDVASVFRIDRQTGRLEFTGNQVKLAAPLCVRYLPRPQ